MLVLEFVWKPMEEIGNAVLALRGLINVLRSPGSPLNISKTEVHRYIRPKTDIFEI